MVCLHDTWAHLVSAARLGQVWVILAWQKTDVREVSWERLLISVRALRWKSSRKERRRLPTEARHSVLLSVHTMMLSFRDQSTSLQNLASGWKLPAPLVGQLLGIPLSSVVENKFIPAQCYTNGFQLSVFPVNFYLFMCVFIHVCMCMCLCVHARMCILVCMYVHVCMCV